MPHDPMPPRVAMRTTRRAVVRAGGKLAYAAPVVAVSFRLRALETGAQGAGSPMCQPGVCGLGIDCSPCRDDFCQLFCSVEGDVVCVDLTTPGCETFDDCSSSADCGAEGVCIGGPCCNGQAKCFRRGDVP